ncbi:MAG: DUF362 domain-containing protein [Firmicutes bacterium]|nr:DUF362 domain-containing protein [Bacillota bacterium]
MEQKDVFVAVEKGENEHEMVSKVISLLGGLDPILGDTVLIKPNLGVNLPSTTGATTNPKVVEAVIKLVREAGVKNVLVGESAVVGYDAGEVFDKLGVRELFENAGAKVVNLDKDDTVELPVENGSVLKKVRVCKTALDCDAIISVPVMKTHFQVTASLGMKNMKGIIPDSMKKRMHRIGSSRNEAKEFELDHAIVDLNSVINKPRLTVIDATTAQEGYNPESPGVGGSPVKFGAVIAGFDPVAVDATAAYLMGFEPLEIRHIKYAFERGLGEARIEKIKHLGVPLEQLRRKFRPATFEALELQYNNITITGESSCTGCREVLIAALARMTEKEIDELGEMEILLGSEAAPTKTNVKRILFGNCAKKLPYEGKSIPGCPPPSFYVKKCLQGEEDMIDW